MANALFLRGFDREILEEMRGIAEGASDAGAKWQDRRVDLVDIVVANVTVEIGELRSAVHVTPDRPRELHFQQDPPTTDKKRDSVLDHCSAFAATGPATRDGKMVIGHVTWWPLTLAEQTNVMLDIKPANGHRVLMQSYPGRHRERHRLVSERRRRGPHRDHHPPDALQRPGHARGLPRAQAIQYGGNIDEMVQHLGTRNNGLYTNEWLIGDGKTNEIAMYELGTNHTKLWRSSKNEWFGNTPGFYWGNNNAKDLAIRLETQPDPQGAPEYIPYVPAVARPRVAWTSTSKHKGQIDEQFAFLAFRTAPLVSGSTMDAKVITADMANRLMVWAAIGKPNQREWLPGGRYGYAGNDGLYPSGYSSLRSAGRPRRRAPRSRRPARGFDFPGVPESRLWKGWILPASETDTWLVAGSAAYHAHAGLAGPRANSSKPSRSPTAA